MVGVKLYVEGGGTTNLLKTACRQGFSEFLAKAGLAGKMPRIVACGSRQDAYAAFCAALQNGEPALLLVDSEGPVSAQYQQGKPDEWQPWQYLLNQSGDGWLKPATASDSHCHLMVQCMESWLLADRQILQVFFDRGFNVNALPSTTHPLESVNKSDLYQALANATKNCKTKVAYDKGAHSFKLLALIDPAKVARASAWAARFIDEVKKTMDVQNQRFDHW